MHQVKFIYGNQPILITGPTGTGKSRLAKEIHKHSKQSESLFIQVNIASLNENLFESEIFGHCKGAFTNAHAAKSGFCGSVGAGSLFLDEIGDLSLQKQASLLKLIDERLYYPVGSNEEKKFMGRLIFATNKNLEEMVAEKTFREDLYFRIRYISYQLEPISIDKQGLALKIWSEINNKKLEWSNYETRFSNDLIQRLKLYDWPGNYRELKNTIDYFFHLNKAQLNISDLPYWIKEKGTLEITTNKSMFKLALADFEREFLSRELEINNGKINQTALVTGINKVTLISKLKKYGIDRRQYKFNQIGRIAHGF
jgi:DNA-binding NtrC family response regulator